MQVKGEPRQTAAAKDSEWVRERLALEESKPSDVNEILLAAAGTPLHNKPVADYQRVELLPVTSVQDFH